MRKAGRSKSTTLALRSRPEAALLVPPNSSGADSDAQLIELWLEGRRSRHSRRAYAADVARFLSLVGKPLRVVTLADMQAFARSLSGAPSSQARTLSAVKSLFAFAHRVGYLPFDVSRPVKLPSRKNTLAERILTESEVLRMIALEPGARNRTLLRLLYVGGLRVSELCELKWRDLQERDDAGQATIFGKGGKTRAVLLPPGPWMELMTLRVDAIPDDPVFRSRKGGHLDPSAVLRLVRQAARRAGIERDVSPHWFRHAHASHALDRGAPIHLVQATLGHASVVTTGAYLHARPTDSSARYLAM